MTLAPARPLTVPARPEGGRLVDQFELGLDAPICLTWELTYACNLACVHCLSSSGRRDPRELSTEECKALIDEFERMQIFYVNIGGGEPTVRPDFWELLDYAVEHHVGVKFSTNGFRITPERAAKLAATDYVDVQISLDGATPEVNDAVRGRGTYDAALKAMANMQDAGMKDFKLSVVCTRHNIGQLDEFKAIADRYGAQLRLTRLRPSGRGADVWEELHPRPEQQRELYDWLVANGDQVLTGDSFFHLSAFAEDGQGALPGLNLCGAGRVVCLVDPVGDVYACPFAIHEQFLAGNVRSPGGFDEVWKHSALFADLRSPQTGRRLPEVLGVRLLPRWLHGRQVLHRAAPRRPGPRVREGQQRRCHRRRPGAARGVAGPLAHRAGAQPAGAADAAHHPAGQCLRHQSAAAAGGRATRLRRWTRLCRRPPSSRSPSCAGRRWSTAHRCSWCRSVPWSSTARTCRWAPTR